MTQIKKLQEQKKPKPYDYVIGPTYWRINLMKAIKLILDFNESKLKDLVSKIEKLKNEWVIFNWKNTRNYWSLYVNNKKIIFFFCI